MPIEPCPSELKISISKFIGRMAHTFLGSCVYPRLVLNLPMLSKSLRASIKYECLRSEDVSRNWSNLSVYCSGSSEIGSLVEFLDQLKFQVSPVKPMPDHRSIRCLPDAPTSLQRFNR